MPTLKQGISRPRARPLTFACLGSAGTSSVSVMWRDNPALSRAAPRHGMPIGSDAVASSGGGAHAISIPRLDLSLISGGSSTDVGNAPPQGPPSPDLKSRTIRQAIKPSQISSRLMTNTYFKSPVKPWVTPGSAKRNVDWAPSSHSTVFCPRSGSEHGIFSRYTRTHEVAALNLTGRVDRDIGYMASHTRAILRHDYAFAALSARPRTVLPKFDPNYQDPSPPKTPRALSPPRYATEESGMEKRGGLHA